MESLTCAMPFKQALTPVNLCQCPKFKPLKSSMFDSCERRRPSPWPATTLWPWPSKKWCILWAVRAVLHTTVCEEGNHAQARLWIKLSECRPAEDGGRLESLALFGTTGLESARYWILLCVSVCVCAAQQQGATLLSVDSMKLLYLCIITSPGLLLGCLVTLDFNFCNLSPARRLQGPWISK